LQEFFPPAAKLLWFKSLHYLDGVLSSRGEPP
jgi:hypothetical protein